MELSPDTAQLTDAIRRDGWSPALKARFLVILAETGNARLSARRCGMSAQSAYVHRRRDPLFAQGWAGALVLALDHGEQVLADRALEGIEEPVFYRGEQIATRRRYDNRLLLAHLARLDRLAADEEAQAAAGRFDELLAIVAGAEPPGSLAGADDGPWPQDREEFAEAAATAAQLAAVAEHTSSPRRFDPGAREACDAAIIGAGQAAHAAAGAEWDAWFDHACATVDGLAADDAPHVDPPPTAGQEFLLQDRVNPSTSPAPPGFCLTLAGPSVIGPPRPAGQEPSRLADHPSETVGAPGLPGLNFQPRRGKEIPGISSPWP
ncbi:MAG: hypothetical protein JF595_04370 [Sphingomonadales bacterium]|nr:hypothetical protein [Sphingomonadales bacterium]